MVLIGTAHNGALVHGGVLADHVFNHGGEDFEAVVPDDEPLDAGIQVDEAVLVDIADIAGVDQTRPSGCLCRIMAVSSGLL